MIFKLFRNELVGILPLVTYIGVVNGKIRDSPRRRDPS